MEVQAGADSSCRTPCYQHAGGGWGAGVECCDSCDSCLLQYFDLRLEDLGPYSINYSRHGRCVYVCVLVVLGVKVLCF